MLKVIASAVPAAPLARALQVVAYGLALLWLAAAGVAALAWLRQSSQPEAWIVALGGGVLGAATGVAVLASLGDLLGQRARDIHAQRVFEAVSAGRTPPPYTLYLRPFASTGAFSQTELSLAGGAPGAFGAEVELEAQMERAVRPLGPLIALGQPLEHIGAGRVLVGDDAWQAAVGQLMQNARLIVMLPSSRPGTLREIEMILDTGLIERTVLIDPPNIARAVQFNHAGEWARVREVFASRNYDVPRDSRAGLLLFFGTARAPKLKERLDIDAEDRIERLFRRVIRDRAAAAH